MSGVIPRHAVHPAIRAAHKNPLALEDARGLRCLERCNFMRTVLLLSITCAAAFAQGVQNMDISFMFGRAHASGAVVVGSDGSATVTGSAGFTQQYSFGYQFTSTKAGSLYLETPLTFVTNVSGTVTGGSVSSLNRSAFYFTPGIRYKIPTGTRVSFYAAAGGGLATYNERDSVVNGQVTATSASSFHPAFDVGGGIDLRLARWLSLRGEARDFVSTAGLGGTVGRNHGVFLFGLAFHF